VHPYHGAARAEAQESLQSFGRYGGFAAYVRDGRKVVRSYGVVSSPRPLARCLKRSAKRDAKRQIRGTTTSQLLAVLSLVKHAFECYRTQKTGRSTGEHSSHLYKDQTHEMSTSGSG